MKLSELRALVRGRIRDTVKPYLVTDQEIDDNLNEAEREACERAQLIEDFDSFTIDLEPGVTRYSLDPRIIDVIDIIIGTEDQREFSDGWTLTETHLVLERSPVSADTLTLHCYRLPKDPMKSANDTPEIRETYHRNMADWAISLCYLIPDSELFNPQAAERYAVRFTQSFGERPSALVRRNHRNKLPPVVAYNGAI